jgi:hypothetical protein
MDPAKIDWPSLGVDLVAESTGLFTNAEDAQAHSRVSEEGHHSAPAKGEDITICLGVNDNSYDPANITSFPTRLAQRIVLPLLRKSLTTLSASSGLMTRFIHTRTIKLRPSASRSSPARAAVLSASSTVYRRRKSHWAGADA